MKDFIIEAWGDLACFTRPEAKVERFSYPVMTPSAARGLLDAIYVKPKEFCWRIERIEVLKPIRFIALRRNEVKDKISQAAVNKAMKGGTEAPVIIADATKDLVGSDQQGRTQRQTMALKDVRYRIYARIQPRKGFEVKLKGIMEQAQRRIESGKCYYQPYFGCREFAAYFEPSSMQHQPIKENLEIGWMLYDVFDLDDMQKDYAEPLISLFKAELKEGVLEVPDWASGQVIKPRR